MPLKALKKLSTAHAGYERSSDVSQAAINHKTIAPMPQISSVLSNLNDASDDGWGIYHKAFEMKENGIHLADLTIGEHDVKTRDSVLDALTASAKGGHTGYAVGPGTHALRSAIAMRATDKTGLATTAADVMVTIGGQGALYAVHKACLSPGDAALYIEPYYPTYRGTLKATGAHAVAIATHARHGFLPQENELRARIDETGAKTLLINSPNNPTGSVYPIETLQMIADICIEKDLWLISDEVYDSMVWDQVHLSPRGLTGMAERTIVIGSVSKSHAMTGSRIGWLIAPPAVIEATNALNIVTTFGAPGYIQDAALFALQEDPAKEDEIAAPFKRRRDLCMQVLARQNVIQAVPSGGSMYLFLNIRATGLSGTDFAYKLLETHHIAVMPGESFGASGAGHLRVALTIEESLLENALRKICDLARVLAETNL